MSFSQLKNAPDHTKHLIFGYVRQCETEQSMNVPVMISYLIIMYYWIQEQFTVHGDNIKLDKTKKIATRFTIKRNQYNTVYGNHVIDTNDESVSCYKWTFQVRNIRSSIPLYPICIGIDASNDKYINKDFSDISINKNYFYSIGTNGFPYNHDEEGNDKVFHGQKVDVMEMTLDMKHKTLTARINHVWVVTIAQNVKFEENKSYNLAIGLSHDDIYLNEIQLTDFAVTQVRG